MSNEAKIIALVAGLVTLLIGGAVYFAMKSVPVEPPVATAASGVSDAGQLVRDDSYWEGDAEAKVTITEFGDFQCPACGVIYPQVQQVVRQYQGRGVRLVFRHFPLPYHRNAQVAATAAEAAGEQGKFWEMADLLYAKQAEWTADAPANKTVAQAEAAFKGYAEQLGLNSTAFAEALTNRKFNSKISRDLADGSALAIDATPTYLVNGVKAEQASDIPAMIDAALAQ